MLKELMDEYYRMNREAADNGLFAACLVYSEAEDLADSFSKSNPSNWVESLINALNSNLESTKDSEEITAYTEAIEIAKILLP